MRPKVLLLLWASALYPPADERQVSQVPARTCSDWCSSLCGIIQQCRTCDATCGTWLPNAQPPSISPTNCKSMIKNEKDKTMQQIIKIPFFFSPWSESWRVDGCCSLPEALLESIWQWPRRPPAVAPALSRIWLFCTVLCSSPHSAQELFHSLLMLGRTIPVKQNNKNKNKQRLETLCTKGDVHSS